MKFSDYSDDVYILYKPVYILSNLMFLASKTSGAAPKTKKFIPSCNSMIILILGVLFTYLAYLAMLDIATVHPIGNSSILINMDRASVCINLILVLVILMKANLCQKEIPSYLSEFRNFDKTIFNYFNEQINTAGLCKKHINKYLLNVFATNMFLAGELIYGCVLYGYIQGYNLFMLFVFLIRQIVVFQYITILNFAYWRFKEINKFIINLEVAKSTNMQKKSGLILVSLSGKVEEKSFGHWDNARVAKLKDNMMMLRILHECLIEVCSRLAETYGVFQAVSIITTLLEQLSQSFGIFVTISNDDDLSDGYLYMTLLRTVGYLFVVSYTHHYFVFYFCDIVEKESKTSGNLMQQMFIKTDYKDQLTEDVRLFSLQLKQNELTFSAAGIFVLNWELMSEIFGEVSSYLIFFIQSSGFSFNNAQAFIELSHGNNSTIGKQ